MKYLSLAVLLLPLNILAGCGSDDGQGTNPVPAPAEDKKPATTDETQVDQTVDHAGSPGLGVADIQAGSGATGAGSGGTASGGGGNPGSNGGGAGGPQHPAGPHTHE